MKTIWKFAVPVKDAFELDLPEGAEILTVQIQRGEPQLWALVDPYAPKVRRKFRVIGTGHPIEDAGDLFWVATIQLHEGSLVFHIFQVIK